jgi:AAA-like domain
MVPSLARIPGILPLMDQKQYFIIHAARQTGKTTFLQQLLEHVETEGKYYPLYCPLESAQVFTDPAQGLPQILYNIAFAVRNSNLPNREAFAKNINIAETSTLVRTAFTDYCRLLDKPLVVFFDEIDALQDGTLITFLRQLREGYITRNKIPFLHSVAMVGMRNIRDYKSKIREDRQTLGSASPFNIVTEAFTLRNFSIEEIAALYQQHTEATGQAFERIAIEKVLEYTGGQPWLVNAIAREIINKILDSDLTSSITPALVEKAAQNIMLRRDTHIDSLLEKLKEERVRKVIEPLILGETDGINITTDDTQYCIDLGLVKLEDGKIKPANPIYNEVIIRALSFNTQFHLINEVKNLWTNSPDKLDMNGLMKAFQLFWRENSEIWQEKYEYKEAAPHLILQAFLQRVINGGGDILREYANGNKRMDICVRYGSNKYPVEIKINYGPKTIPDALVQLSEYMDKLSETTGWLVVFDRTKSKTWEEKIKWETVLEMGKTIHIVFC